MKTFSPAKKMPKIEVSWGLPFLLTMLLVGAYTIRDTVSLFAPTESVLVYSLSFTGLIILYIFLHELGHVLVAKMLGMEWDLLKLGAAVGVGFSKKEGAARTYNEQALISFAGPITHMTVTAGVLYLCHLLKVPPSSAVVAATLLGFVDGFLNLAIPLKAGDGGKAARACFAIVRGRGQAAFK